MKRLMSAGILVVLSLAFVTHLTPAPAAAQWCGDGVIDPGEGCDPPAPPCCSGACQCVLGATCTGCFAPGLCNYSGVPSTCQCDTNVAFPPLDHYRVYNAAGPPGPIVTLRDQFQTENDVALGPVLFFLPPVKKNNEDVTNPFDHLTCYHIPVGQYAALVTVDNQFGSQVVDVTNPVALCVPTQKLLDPNPPPTRIDHYKCYEATGPPVGRTVIVEDQFEPPLPVTVEAPFLFCAPVDKNGEGITNPVDHLTCYFTDPPGAPVGPIPIRNQFHPLEVVDVLDSSGLCVPSQKREVTRPCADSAPPQCNGTCRRGEACVRVSFGPMGEVCECAPSPACGPEACPGNCPTGWPCICAPDGDSCACGCL